MSGQLSHDSAGASIGTGDFEPRMWTTPGNPDRVLEHFGARRDQIVETPSWYGACGTTSTPSPARPPARTLRTAATSRSAPSSASTSTTDSHPRAG
ncbi:hypothetical protein ABZZ36_06975 [Actinacidiphila glaucinigra]|uniref:hypothetical protein n=1 Tax=Actinacidiphila glaucinigra TaxID=235986 RepID=UPI0033A1B292